MTVRQKLKLIGLLLWLERKAAAEAAAKSKPAQPRLYKG